jgi:mannose-1-phosphate guanylyltransferase
VALPFHRLDAQAVMIVITADHHIEDVDTFCACMQAACAVAQDGYLVTLGITPTYPATGYGYIRFGERLSAVEGFEVFEAAAFTEKPDRERAQAFVDAGTYGWNSGMFIWRVDRILQEIALWMPALHHVLTELGLAWDANAYVPRLADLWPTLSKETIDYGIMERADRVAVIPVDMGWSDIGTWASVMQMHTPDEAGNVLVGDVMALATERSMVLARGDRLVVAIGLDDVIVVDTPDAVLVTRREMSERVRDIVQQLQEQHRLDRL